MSASRWIQGKAGRCSAIMLGKLDRCGLCNEVWVEEISSAVQVEKRKQKGDAVILKLQLCLDL